MYISCFSLLRFVSIAKGVMSSPKGVMSSPYVHD